MSGPVPLPPVDSQEHLPKSPQDVPQSSTCARSSCTSRVRSSQFLLRARARASVCRGSCSRVRRSQVGRPRTSAKLNSPDTPFRHSGVGREADCPDPLSSTSEPCAPRGPTSATHAPDRPSSRDICWSSPKLARECSVEIFAQPPRISRNLLEQIELDLVDIAPSNLAHSKTSSANFGLTLVAVVQT